MLVRWIDSALRRRLNSDRQHGEYTHCDSPNSLTEFHMPPSLSACEAEFRSFGLPPVRSLSSYDFPKLRIS